MSNDSMGGIVLGLLAGAAIGVGIGMLYAPQPGRRTRRNLQKQAHEFRNRAEHFGEQVKERAEEAGETVKKSAEKYRHDMLAKLD
ncbi:MAG: YtxH domain-containing protein [Dehalogenimonas sp.]|uniref:YtxH domain-containing protein n=1 Tax=Candidatus Dehalogenimonas loeffleri TaxID=3127115 RepID=A0ABZ2J564_9CHLR|nr:YtxH domain-containing protein [Dehalogenimonas sp.]